MAVNAGRGSPAPMLTLNNNSESHSSREPNLASSTNEVSVHWDQHAGSTMETLT